jgi:hypothetical protein
MHIELALIPGEVQTLAQQGANLGQEVKAALQSNTAIEVEALVDKFFPEAAGLREELITLVTAATNTCEKIATADWSGVTSRLQRLVADTTSILHGQKHTLSTYIQWVEAVIRDVLDMDNAPATRSQATA